MPAPPREKNYFTPHARRSRAARGFAKWSATRLGEALGHGKEYVTRRENGEYDYSDAELAYIAHLTGVPMTFMLTGFSRPGKDLAARLDKLAVELATSRAAADRPAAVAGLILEDFEQSTPGESPTAQEPTSKGSARRARRKPPASGQQSS